MCNKIQMLSDRSLLIDTLIFLPVKLFNFLKEKYSNVIGNKASSNLDLLNEEKWKHCALDLLIKKGIVQDRDGLTPEEVWQTAKNSFTQEKF